MDTHHTDDPSWRMHDNGPGREDWERGRTMTSLRERFGRALRLAIVGGGPDAWIGRMHRGAAEMDRS